MSTIHARAVREAADDLIRSDHEAHLALDEFVAAVNAGAYPGEWVDAVFQKSRGEGADIYDAFVFARIERMVQEGSLAVLAIRVSGGPLADDQDAANNRILAGLPRPFSAEFRGGRKYDSDGVFAWDEPVEFLWNSAPGATTIDPILIPPSRVALEVGTTASSRTLCHLMGTSGLARWPYGSSVITVMKRMPETLQAKARG